MSSQVPPLTDEDVAERDAGTAEYFLMTLRGIEAELRRIGDELAIANSLARARQAWAAPRRPRKR